MINRIAQQGSCSCGKEAEDESIHGALDYRALEDFGVFGLDEEFLLETAKTYEKAVGELKLLVNEGGISADQEGDDSAVLGVASEQATMLFLLACCERARQA